MATYKIKSLFKQSSLLGKWWGNLQQVAQQTNIYIQVAILSFSSISAYGVISEGASQRGYIIPFWLFAVVCISGLLVICLIVWKFMMHSTFASWNEQMWNHGCKIRERWDISDVELDRKYNELFEKFAEIKKQLDRLEKRLDER